jgi:adenine deaminase
MVSDRLLAVARGEEQADLVLANCRIVNVFTGEIQRDDVGVADGVIASVGGGVRARQTVDLGGRYLCPGLIDAHVHIESSLVGPFEFARAVVPHGTTTVVADPHEIANVCGIEGVGWMLESSEELPLSVVVAASSCVPATPLATAGASLGAMELKRLRGRPRVVALGEMMNVPGVVLGDPEVRRKLEVFRGLPVDGHAPGLGGRWLDAYAAAGIGSDHECVTAEEALARLRLGMRVFLREGSGAKNLVDLLPAVTPATLNRCALCTDDRHPHDLLDDGHIDHLIRLAIRHGVEPVSAVRMATINAAEWFRLHDRGAVAPGRRADLIVVADLADFCADMVVCGGRVVAEGGATVGNWRRSERADDVVRKPVRIDSRACELKVPAISASVRVIGMVPGQIRTEHLVMELPRRNGVIVPDAGRDVAKLAVVERHRGSGRIGLGFVRGLGLCRGALASSVAHDHHNLIVAGMDDTSMYSAIAAVVDAGGGLAVADGERVVQVLPLPLAGLMSDRSVEEVRRHLDRLVAAVGELGCPRDPFMTMSFLALEVIPSLKLTDLGLVDVERFELVPLAV